MFTYLKIENFRGIKKLEIDNLKPINIIVGKNGCGKTSVLEAMMLNIGFSNPIGVQLIQDFREVFCTNTEFFKYPFYNLDVNNDIHILLKKDEENFRNLLLKPIIQQKLNSNFLTTKNDEIVGSRFEMTKIEDNKSLQLVSSIKIKEFLNKNGQIAPIFEYFPTIDYVEKTEGIYYPHVNLSLTKELLEVIQNIIRDKNHKKEFIKTLHIIEPEIEDIGFAIGDILEVTLLNKNTSFPLRLMGNGMSIFLIIITILYRFKNGFVLIDEIEIGLHFSILKPIWKTIINLSKQLNVQLFITTHSDEVIKYLNEAIKEENFENEVCVFDLVKLKNKEHKIYRLEGNDINYAIEQNIEIRR